MATRNRAEALAARLSVLLDRLTRRDEGQGMVEYAMILMMVAIALLLIVGVIGKQTNNMFSNISNGLASH
jgi:pilus assembly protein Flp/PilA